VVRRRGHAEHVRRHHHGPRRDDPGRARPGTWREHQPRRDIDVRADPRLGPEIPGQNVANPIATVWAGALLLDSLGEFEAAEGVVRAIERTIAYGVVTRDMGGASSTSGVGDHLVRLLQRRG